MLTFTLFSSFLVNSTTSLASSVTSTKYDPDLLRADIALGRERVTRLKRELAQVHSEMLHKEKGVETLARCSDEIIYPC